MLDGPCALLSDVHLGVSSPEVERSLVAFLRSLHGRARSVVINGDLFDFWFEWRTVIPRDHYRTLAALADLREQGIDVVMTAGNHDGWGGEFLRQDVGISYQGDGVWQGAIAGWRARVEHGDGLRPAEDRRYRMLRAVIRHPLAVRAFRFMHPDLGTRIARGSSTASREHRLFGDSGDGLRRIAHARLTSEPSMDLLVFGHSHSATLERVPGAGVYANAGSWLNAPTYLWITDDRIELRRWAGSAEDDRLDAVDRVSEKALRKP
jgi:UDP-2,3-diacylglucosamine hydrolase